MEVNKKVRVPGEAGLAKFSTLRKRLWEKRVYLAAHLGNLQGVQKPGVCSSHDSAFHFFIFFFVFNLEQKKKVYHQGKRNFAIYEALVLTRARGTIRKKHLPVFLEPRKKIKVF